MNQKKLGLFEAIGAVLLWATLGVGFKVMTNVSNSFTPALLIGITATLALFLYLVFREKLSVAVGEFKKQPFFFIMVGILGLGVQQVLYLKAYSLQSASSTVIVYYIYPLLMVFFSSVFFKKPIPRKAWICILTGFLGICIVMFQNNGQQFSFNLGIFVTLAAAACWAAFSVLIGHRKFEVETGIFLLNFFGTLFLIALVPFFGISMAMTPMNLTIILYLGIFTTGLAFILWTRALRHISIQICANLALLIPALSILLITLVLKEKITIAHLAGLALITASILVHMHSPSRNNQEVRLLRNNRILDSSDIPSAGTKAEK